ncbi:MAG: host attachment protein [Pseudomonadota bacterium]|nr:host attachment protein [Pseudomonadota bacterium]
MKDILVIVGNASRARLYSVRHGVLERLESLAHPESRAKVSELLTDRPGRAFDSTGAGHSEGSPQRSGMEPHTDPHDLEIEAFAKQVARRASIHARRGHFAELLLIAPPRFLGRLKIALDEAVARRIVATVSHDYTSKTDSEVVDILETLGVSAALPSPA